MILLKGSKYYLLRLICFFFGCWPEKIVNQYPTSEVILNMRWLNGEGYHCPPYMRKKFETRFICGRCGRLGAGFATEERTLTEDEREEHNI